MARASCVAVEVIALDDGLVNNYFDLISLLEVISALPRIVAGVSRATLRLTASADRLDQVPSACLVPGGG